MVGAALGPVGARARESENLDRTRIHRHLGRGRVPAAQPLDGTARGIGGPEGQEGTENRKVGKRVSFHSPTRLSCATPIDIDRVDQIGSNDGPHALWVESTRERAAGPRVAGLRHPSYSGVDGPPGPPWASELTVETEELQTEIAKVTWYHSIPLGDG